ncbi:MAG: DUF4349 domain-containing protein [Actinophytocola sp.]|nr:DUF4349 domain-containing protein [Actinophytocola sp.]
MKEAIAVPMRRPLGAVLAVLVSTAALAACGAGSDTASDSGEGQTRREAKPTSRSGTEATNQPKDEQTRSAGKQTAEEKRLMTYTAAVRVRVKDPRKTSTKADGIVTKAGGYVETQRQFGEDPESSSSTTTYRVPSAKYKSVLGQLGKLGTRTSLSQKSATSPRRSPTSTHG